MKPSAFLAGALVAAPFALGQAASQKPATHGLVTPSAASAFVGSQTCRSCHASTHASWTEGRHSRMLQPAKPTAVIPSFDRAIELHGKEYRLTREGDDFFIIESYLQSTPTKRHVDYTLGSRRVQHYLSRLDDGRIVVLPPSYDVEKKEWFHNLDIVDLEESGAVKVQVWNSNCFGCHASGEEKGFDPKTKSYETTWTDFGTGCERCHGPGQAHGGKYRARASGSAAGEDSGIVHPGRLDKDTSTAVCAQCHTLRDITQPGFTAGSDFYDYFTPLLEYAQKKNHDPAYWPNGRPRRFSNEAMAFWESQCFYKGGATCLSCHNDVHEPNVERNGAVAAKNDSLCSGCHQKIANEGAAHSHHMAAGAEGSKATASAVSCVSCHMPRTVMSLRHRMPDHTISVPAPVNTTRFGIPNACNECHKDKTAEWSESKLAFWFPDGRREQSIADAIAFSGGGRRDPAAISLLIDIASDVTRPPLFRANAVGHLRNYKDAAATKALLGATASDATAVRAIAFLSLTDRAKEPVVREAMMLGIVDARRTVRMASALGLLNAGPPFPTGEVARAMNAAMRDHATRADFLKEDPTSQVDLGKMFFLAGDSKRSETAIRAGMLIDPQVPGGAYFLGLAMLGQGRVNEGTALLRAVSPDDPNRKAAEAVLAKLKTPATP